MKRLLVWWKEYSEHTLKTVTAKQVKCVFFVSHPVKKFWFQALLMTPRK